LYHESTNSLASGAVRRVLTGGQLSVWVIGLLTPRSCTL